ncbi:MAG: hypothetical protein ACI9R3_004592, partial [Verrucomicrobiales bacterium]
QLFSHLKKRGFDLEATHMSEAAKLEKLFALVTLAFLFSFAWGCHLRATKKVTKALKRKSLFRQGQTSCDSCPTLTFQPKNSEISSAG